MEFQKRVVIFAIVKKKGEYNMEPFKERLLVEQKELAEREEKLLNFLANENSAREKVGDEMYHNNS